MPARHTITPSPHNQGGAADGKVPATGYYPVNIGKAAGRLSEHTGRLHMKFTSSILAIAASALVSGGANAAALSFSSASATFEQNSSGLWTAALAIDGNTTSTGLPSGWAIFNDVTGKTDSQTALFTLATPLAAGSYSFTYTLFQALGLGSHTLGDFSLAFTTAAGPVLASSQTLVNLSSAS